MTEQERYENMVDEIIDLKNEIKDLQAENERLKNHIQEGIDLAKQIPEMLAITKAEAYKEFADKLNIEAEKVEIDREGDFVETGNKIYDTVANWCKATTDNLLKELVGDK